MGLAPAPTPLASALAAHPLAPARSRAFMHWIAASLVSAFFLGCYDLATKHAVRDNAVLPVLFIANLCSALLWTALIALQHAAPDTLSSAFTVTPLTATQHGLMILKSTLVAASWICSYFAVKHLPVSLAAPIRAIGPVWTLFGALLVLGERPTWLEMVGVAITLASFFALSIAGREEGINFRRNPWIAWLLAGTLLGALSGLYDKYLLGRAGFTASTVQAWFSIYLAAFFFPLVVGWKLRWWPRHTFHWRWSIVLVSAFLLVCDFIYFSALRDPEALVSLVASLRRGSLLVAFVGGLWLFKESYSHKKLFAALGVLTGIVLTVLG